MQIERFSEQHVCSHGLLMRGNIEGVIAESDLLGVGLIDALMQHVREDQTVLDLVNVPKRSALRGIVLVIWRDQDHLKDLK